MSERRTMMIRLKILNLVFFSLLALTIVQSTSESHDALLTKNTSRQAGLKRRIFKRNIECPQDEYFAGSHCCKMCHKGTYLNSSCVEAHGEPDCQPCIRGKEYMDHPNHLIRCERCSSCDHGQGLEVFENCTEVQNTKCQCMKSYFCNSTAECHRHCQPCDKCENGVEHECTPTHNTVCKVKEGRNLGWIAVPVILIVIILGVICIYRNKHSITEDTSRHRNDTNPEEVELLPDDVDLQPHLSEISEKFKKEEMLKFVRKNGFREPEIDAILNNNQNQEEEQKFKLLERWYQSHGKTGAYRTLISNLRTLKLNILVDDIKGTVSISSGQENVDSSSIPFEDRNERELQNMEEEF
ncbi:tumor necrosis factor receptor superfamily member 6 [Microcaecilia unicolor]|uniref:Tumor necrosis factor receptor superfamily member 6 n=1 Tax=Microcaecilia unicolor TaxID=1415580 RepID=A0A6P7YCB5_9AMPH|nr:tumor necrosis factor receptor superfamily member 6 [Microcaecilia unicolor]